MTLRIENISRKECIEGGHLDPRQHPTVLIQICEVEDEHAVPLLLEHFVKTIQLKFDDVEDPFDMNCISEGQAGVIANALKEAKLLGHDVVVHCYAGICRSGAVAEVGTIIGFEVANGRWRMPNTLVKRRILEKLNLSFNPEFSPFAVNEESPVLQDKQQTG